MRAIRFTKLVLPMPGAPDTSNLSSPKDWNALGNRFPVLERDSRFIHFIHAPPGVVFGALAEGSQNSVIDLDFDNGTNK